MATTVSKRGTAMPDADTNETVRLVTAAAHCWVISGGLGGANATCVSITAAKVFLNGILINVAASASCAMTGTLAASTTGAFVLTLADGATLQTVVCTGVTVGALGFPTIAASQGAIGVVVIACTATAFNGGTNSLADSSYVVSAFNFAGPSGLALTTENFTSVPG